MLYYILQANPLPVGQPTFDTIIPWILFFLASMVSGLVWYVLRDLKDVILKLVDRIQALIDAVQLRGKATDEAIDRAAQSNLMLVVSLPQTELAKQKATQLDEDIEQARRDRNKT
jgi:hypothetical protein